MNTFIEISDGSKCPCGSGKRYKNCCKKKNYKFGYQEGKLVKQVPMTEDSLSTLDTIKQQFQDYYGRLPENDEYVMAFAPVYNDETLLQSVYLLRELNVPEHQIYAYYHSDGLFPCEINLDLLAETDLKEYKDLCSEYDKLINSPIKTSANAVQFVQLSNSFLQEQLEYINHSIIDALNDFIRRHCGSNSIYDYQMESEVDYLIFSALKTIKVLQSIEKLMKNHLTECIYALGRGIFENYMYVCNINVDSDLFRKNYIQRLIMFRTDLTKHVMGELIITG